MQHVVVHIMQTAHNKQHRWDLHKREWLW